MVINVDVEHLDRVEERALRSLLAQLNRASLTLALARVRADVCRELAARELVRQSSRLDWRVA